MIQQSESLNSWAQDIPQTSFQIQPTAPKKLLKVIDLLKRQNIFTIKAKFGFSNEFEKKKFIEIYKKQENDQYLRESEIRKQSSQKKSYTISRLKNGKGCIFSIGSYLRSQIFLNAYRGNKLDELEKKYNLQIFPLGQDLYIQDSQGGTNIKKDSIIYSQVMDMQKRLKIYIFFNEPELGQIVKNSEYFKKRLQKIGIRSYVRTGRSTHIAFYSHSYEPQQIRRQVLKQNSLQSRVLKLGDNQLSYQNNMRIFDVLVKSIKFTIDQLRDTYEANLQINKNNSCFILHLQHEVFAEQPISEISEVISHLFIMSFPLRQSRSFINQLRRNSKQYDFIHASHYKKTAFCCINRKKIQNKKDILAIFAPFLQELSEKSKLTIHMKANCILQQNSTMPQQILDLTQQCKLEVEQYQNIINKQKFNIVVKPRLFNSQAKKKQKQLQFSNFFLKLLMLEQNQRQITQDELDYSILNNSMIVEQKTDDSVNNKRVQRGNRNRGAQRSQQQKINSNQNQQNSKSKNQQKNSNKTEGRQGRSGREGRQGKEKVQQVEEKRQIVESMMEVNNCDNSWYQQQSNIVPPKIKKNMYDSNFVQFKYSKPAQLEGDDLFKKAKQDHQLCQTIEKKEGQSVKTWKLKINYNFYNFSTETQGKINPKKCYLVSHIEQNNKIPQKLIFKKFNQLQSQQTAYIIYQSQDSSCWIPTHMIQKI